LLDLLTKVRAKPFLLLVDDQPSAMLQLNDIFKHDFEIFMTTDGTRALELCLTVCPDLILLDVMMPSIDGYQLCEQIKAIPNLNHIPIIFITASDDASGEVKGFNSGAVDYVHKPIDSKIALARVKNQLSLKLQADKLRSLAMIDGLTGIGNRLHLEESLHAYWLACVRKQSAIALLMIDIDNFKSFNDHYGHVMGDECIKHIAQRILSCLERPLDMVARFGGEEFLCILPETELLGASKVANKIIDQVQRLKIPHIKSNIAEYVTVSIGVSSAFPTLEDDYHILIEKADQQLYVAKTSGKNKMCCS
jgi:diguanylate cyclase (GGDEF)-like protein